MPKLELPADFAKAIADALGWKLAQVDDTFDFEEDKQGFFWAKLKPKKFLDTGTEFRAMCALVRDLGGEDYLKGAKAWKIPGPYCTKKEHAPEAPKPVTTSTPTSIPTPLPSTSQPQDARRISNQLRYDKSKPPEIPNIKFIPVDAIKIPPFLPTRKLISYERLSEIRESIKKHGQRYPIKVRRFNNDYELIDGYLRLQSVQQLSWKGILAEIKDATDQEVLVESLIVNKNRIEEDPITVAEKLDILINAFGYTQEKLAEEIGISQPQISKVLSLLKLPKDIQRQIALSEIGLRHALTLFTVNNVEMQTKLAKEIVEKELTVPQLEERIDELQPRPSPEPVSPPEPEVPSQLLEPTTQPRRFVQPEPSESKTQIVKRAFDVWGIAAMDTEKPFGDKDYPGNIPGDIVGNVLLWFLPDGGKVVDPMAGGGVTEDVCKFLGIEKYPSVLFDSKRLHSYQYRETIKYADVSDGKLPDEANNAALVFADPPYGPLKEYGMTINDLYRVLSGLAKAAYGCLKVKGIAAVLMQNYYAENECQGEFIPLVRRTIEIFEATGFKQIFEITVPLYGKVARSKISMTHIDRRLMVFQK
jgi:ParB family chromosome partitioning protein